MKFGLGLLPNRPVKELVEDAVIADQSGFDTIWLSETNPAPTARNPFVILTQIAESIEHAKFGTCIVSPHKWHPAVLAQTVATFDEIKPGRMVLGIGVGGRALRYLDRWWYRPILAIRESITILRRLFAGETVTYTGRIFQTSNTVLDPAVSLGKDQPIYIAARGPQMITLSGEIADGNALAAPATTVKWAMDLVRKGAQKSGRDPSKIDITNWTRCSISSDYSKAIEAVKFEVANAVSYNAGISMELAGYSPEVPKKMETLLSDEEAAREYVSDQMIKDFSISGTPDDWIKQLETYEAVGQTQLVMGVPYGPDIREAIRLVGKEVIPSFRKG